MHSFCSQEIDWGNVAEWATVGIGALATCVALLAAIATFCAVWVALKSSKDALNHAQLLRDEERRDAEKIRRLKCKAFSAAVVDEMWQAHKHGSMAVAYMEELQLTPIERAKGALKELAQIRTEFMSSMIQSIEVFGDPEGKILARTTATLMEQRAASERNLKILENRTAVNQKFTDSLKGHSDRVVLKIREAAPLFYDLAEIDPASRSIPVLTDKERDRLYSPAHITPDDK